MESVEPGESGACNKAIHATGTGKQSSQFNDKRGIAQIRKTQRSGVKAMTKTVEDVLANRPRDQGDVADVLFVQGQLDESYMRHWAHQLDITDRLNTALVTRE